MSLYLRGAYGLFWQRNQEVPSILTFADHRQCHNQDSEISHSCAKNALCVPIVSAQTMQDKMIKRLQSLPSSH